MKSSIKRIKIIYILLFVLLMVHLLKTIILETNGISVNPYNTRMNKIDESIIRGNILDKNNKILATTIVEDSIKIRKYPYNNAFCHVVGYSSRTKTGIEALTNKYLITKKWNVVDELFSKEFKSGANVVTTLDADLQVKASEILKNSKGGVIILEPTTGEILALVSKPDYNPNDINEIWDTISKDEDTNPLLNRITQGLYPPGSIFKIIPSLAMIEDNIEGDFQYVCSGQDVFDENIISCYNHNAHNLVDLSDAFSYSCNTAFSSIGVLLGGDRLKRTAEKLYFNKKIPFALDTSISKFNLDDKSPIKEIAETSIGQGQTLVTPYHMAMIVSSIANGGVLMKSYVVDEIKNENNKIIKKTIPEKLDELMSFDSSMKMQSLMREVVLKGTAKSLNFSDIKVYAKTGTAENETQIPHSWVVGFAEYNNKKICFVVLVENGGNSYSTAVPIAKKLISYYYNGS